MTDTELLKKVKAGLGIFTDYQDETLQIYIDETREFMKAAGVCSAALVSPVSVGCILRGVADLWNYGSGSVGFSEYFKQRVNQLSCESVPVSGYPIIYDLTLPTAESMAFDNWKMSNISETMKLYYINTAKDCFDVADGDVIKILATATNGETMTDEETARAGSNISLLNISVVSFAILRNSVRIDNGDGTSTITANEKYNCLQANVKVEAWEQAAIHLENWGPADA